MSRGQKPSKPSFVVRPVDWLRGISGVVVGETVYVARQRNPKLTRMLAAYVFRLSRASTKPT